MKKLFSIIRFIWMYAYVRWLDLWERWFMPHIASAGVPPPSLRYRVSGTPDRNFYLWYGKLIWDTISKKLDYYLPEINQKHRILDYGCGCARMGRHVDLDKYVYTGTDTDSVALEWCMRSQHQLGLFVDPDSPSLHKGSQSVIVSVSVFSHIPFDLQKKMLKQFNKMLIRGGIVILIVHGAKAVESNHKKLIGKYLAESHLYRESRFMKGCFSSAYHSSRYAYRNWVETGFRVLEYDEGGLNGWQDIVVLKKR